MKDKNYNNNSYNNYKYFSTKVIRLLKAIASHKIDKVIAEKNKNYQIVLIIFLIYDKISNKKIKLFMKNSNNYLKKYSY